MRALLMSVVIVSSTFSLAFTRNSSAQELPKPGPEHELLKAREGVWEATVKSADGSTSKATSTNKMTMGGLWLEGGFEGPFGE